MCCAQFSRLLRATRRANGIRRDGGEREREHRRRNGDTGAQSPVDPMGRGVILYLFVGADAPTILIYAPSILDMHPQ